MALPKWTTSVLLASLILLFWSTSAWSDSSINPSALTRFKRAEGKDITEKALAVVTSSLSVVKDVVDLLKKDETITVLKALSDFAALAPGIGSAIASIISLILLFIPAEDKVMDKFAEVNRKLDSISIQISNLQTDVKVYNYLSSYSDHEATIVTAWKKLLELYDKKKSDKQMKSETVKFTTDYKNNLVQKSVENLFHYLTVEGIAMSENINKLYKEKYKCHIGQMGLYSLYLSDLMFKGMVLNQAYLQLTGKSSPNDKTKMIKDLKKLYEIQIDTIHSCLKKETYNDQIKKDVMEQAKGIDAKKKKDIATNVKRHLDNKYSWYNWVVVVYDTKDEKKHKIFEMTKIPAGAVTVAVTYTLKSDQTNVKFVQKAAQECFEKIKCKIDDRLKDCQNIYFKSEGGSDRPVNIVLSEYAKVTDMTKSKSFVELPEPTFQIKCKKNFLSKRNRISVHYSEKLIICNPGPCQNKGECERLLDSNQFWCKCKDGFHGEKCEKKIDTAKIDEMIKNLPSTKTAKKSG
ncbi:SE-cephalotoxin-like [Cololabis saira]|uniref:SE-cephalotoxin-like n=1 Tax=Cololabis saira TaxID=129043 RepID=UPI002AD51177|nr:SE-cephalotoxin-like [Cololabis saira]